MKEYLMNRLYLQDESVQLQDLKEEKKNNNSNNNNQSKLISSKSTNDIKQTNKISYSLFSEEERKAISTLFNNKEDYEAFYKKISVLETYKS